MATRETIETPEEFVEQIRESFRDVHYNVGIICAADLLRKREKTLVNALQAIAEYADNQADVSRDLEAADSIEFGEIAEMARVALPAPSTKERED